MSFPSVACLPMCPCWIDSATGSWSLPSPICRSRKRHRSIVVNSCSSHRNRRVRSRCGCSKACAIPSDGPGNRNHSVNVGFANSARLGTNRFLLKRFSQDSTDGRELAEDSPAQLGSQFSNFEEDPIVGKLRTHLGVIHPIPSPPINRNIAGLFVFFFFVGVVFDKFWTSRKKTSLKGGGQLGVWPQVPTSFSAFLEKDLQRKESVEWVNMVLGKLWKVYRVGIENWIIGLLQPVIDDLKKPDYVQRVEIKQFSLGDEPLSVRNVERRTSRSVNDLQYQIGIRYTGGARMLLMLSLNFGVVPIVIPVGVRDFDIDGELWVKLRLIPSEPWVGAASWAFVSLPKIKIVLSPFRLFNLMGYEMPGSWKSGFQVTDYFLDYDYQLQSPGLSSIPVLSMFLTKLLTEDLPRLFVRPKKIVLDFQKGKAVGPVVNDFLSKERQEGNKDYAGELSVTLVDARKLSYVFYGKTDPYVILCMGDQEIRSKKNSQTTVIGPPGEPIWNQDFHMLVGNPRKDKLYVTVKDSLGFGDLTVGIGEVDLGSLEDTVPTDTIVALQGGWGLPGKKSSGEILLRLTYKAYVEDEEDDWTMMESIEIDGSDDELSDSDEYNVHRDRKSKNETEKESFMDVLAALIVSEEFQGIVATETGNTRFSDPSTNKGSLWSKSPAANAQPLPSDPDSNSDGSRGSSLVWFAVITSIAVVIAINMSNSGVFNP